MHFSISAVTDDDEDEFSFYLTSLTSKVYEISHF